MKNHKLLLLLVFCPLHFFGQSLSGLWTGTLTNDSSSVRQDQSFEIILSQYKEKVYGYSRSTFIVNDTLYYIVKRVKGTIQGDVCEVADDHVVSHNFPKKPEKGVRVISTFRRNIADSTWYLEGDWKTTKTKRYYSVSGKVDLKEEKDLAASKLFPHLEELGLDRELPAYAAAVKKGESNRNVSPSPGKEQVVVAKSRNDNMTGSTTGSSSPERTEPEVARAAEKSNPVPAGTSGIDKAELPTKPQPEVSSPVAANKKVQEGPPSSPMPAAESKEVVQAEPKKNDSRPDEAIAAKKVSGSGNNVTAPEPTPSTVKAEPAPVMTNDQPRILEDLGNTVIVRRTAPPAPVQNNTVKAQPTPARDAKGTTPAAENAGNRVSKPAPVQTVTAPADKNVIAQVNMRKTEAPQFVNYVSDSLVLILYDNGEIDGDTVSVLLNGGMLMERQGLSTAAIRKTIYITPGNEDLTLVLFAENLGRYPPNTGLLVVYDGETRHQLRFSADFQKNASVMFRRK